MLSRIDGPSRNSRYPAIRHEVPGIRSRERCAVSLPPGDVADFTDRLESLEETVDLSEGTHPAPSSLRDATHQSGDLFPEVRVIAGQMADHHVTAGHQVLCNIAYQLPGIFLVRNAVEY